MLKLRPYKRCDARKVASWIASENEFYIWSAGILGSYPLTGERFVDFCVSKADDDTFFGMVAERDNEAVGYVALSYPDPEDRSEIRMSMIIVDSAKRGRGYGIGMLKLAISYAFDYLKVTRLTAGVFEQNVTARQTYRTLGFNETGESYLCDIKGDKWKRIVVERFAEGNSRPAADADTKDEIIKEIIDNNKLNYAYQPIVDSKTGEIFGYEALMRADTSANVSPLDILNYATRENRLFDIERLTFENVMRFFTANLNLFHGKKIFINSIPGNQPSDELYAKYQEINREYIKYLVIEITEYREFEGEELNTLIDRSSRDGFEIAIDDYGTGFSNTSSLLKYLPHYLKIDRLLISNIHEEPKKQHFVKSIIEFAQTNGFKTLAEGVETSAELNCVIELGVDLIQGYYTARPSFEVIESIHEDIKNEIISFSVKGSNQDVRKIYTLNGETELPVMRLALEQYTGILIDQEEFTLVGNTGYSAEMSVKIKDGIKTRLTIRDMFLESINQLPCIELGDGSELTLVLEGENRMTKFGIMVPESSTLIIEGDGNLQIRAQGKSSFAIGNISSSGVGDITWRGTGSLDILVEADDGIGIGGGEFRSGCGMNILSGAVRIEPASGKAIAIGAKSGKPHIRISECSLRLDVKIDKGIGIGCMNGAQDIAINNAKVNVMCAGREVAGIGSIESTGGRITIDDSEMSVMANGQQLYLIGAKSGDLDIRIRNSTLDLKGEGNGVLAMGSADLSSHIRAEKAICNVKLASGNPVVYGTKPEDAVFAGGISSVSVNE